MKKPLKKLLLTLTFSAIGVSCFLGLTVRPFGLGTSVRAHDLRTPAGAPKSWTAECGSCHLPYPPSLLTAPDWSKIMQGLDKHFGSDASMSASEVREISSFLQQNASTQESRYQSTQNPPRLTRTPWFERKHRKIPAEVWAAPKVKSAANCAACHTKAETGQFSDHDVSVPGYPGKHW